MAYVYSNQDEAFDALEAASVPVGTRVVRNHDDDTWHFVDLDGAVVADPADVVADVPRVAEAGDLVLQIGGAMTSPHAMLAAIAYAKKLGLDVTLRDAFSLEVVRTVSKADGRGSRVMRVAAPSETQQIIIDLCSRPSGATGDELLAAGAGGKAKPGAISWSQLAMACERYGYSYTVSGRTVLNKKGRPVNATVYHLRPISAANDVADDLKLAAD